MDHHPTAGKKKRKTAAKPKPRRRPASQRQRQRQSSSQSQRVTVNIGTGPRRRRGRRRPAGPRRGAGGPIVIPVPQPYSSHQPFLQENERALPAYGGGAAIGPPENLPAPREHDHSARGLSASVASEVSLRRLQVQAQALSQALSEASLRTPLRATNRSVADASRSRNEHPRPAFHEQGRTPMRPFRVHSPTESPGGRPAAARPLEVRDLFGRVQATPNFSGGK